VLRGRKKSARSGVALAFPFLVLAIVALVVTLVGSAAANSHRRAGNVLIGWSDPLASEEGLRAVGYGETRAIQQLGLAGWKVKDLDAALSSNKQVSDIATFQSLGAKAITSWTLDQGALDPAYKRARAAGIPVIGVDTFSKYFITVAAGYTDTTCIVANQQAQYIAHLVPHAKVLAIGGPPAPSITLTTNCFLKAAKAQGLQVLEHEDDLKGTEANGQVVAQGMLTKHPDVQAVWVFSDNTALGASAALHAAGKTVWSGSHKGVVLVSRNGVGAAIAAIKSGNLTASWDNEQPEVGSAALQIVKYILVDKAPLSKLPKIVRIPSKRWDLTDANTYVDLLHRKVPLMLPKKFPGKFPKIYTPKLPAGFGY
jgi:ribose transport system substrate-binding protein